MSRRAIHKARRSARNPVREALEFALLAELLDPSDHIWLVSPWINDIPLLDNTAGAFWTVCPDFEKTEVGLSQILRELIRRGSAVTLVTRPGIDQFLSALTGPLSDEDAERLRQVEKAELHTKGMTGRGFALRGSMNFTFNGLLRLDELVQFSTDPGEVHELRTTFEREYGAHD